MFQSPRGLLLILHVRSHGTQESRWRVPVVFPVSASVGPPVASLQGDSAASAAYRSKMGPENYAFCIGKDVVIVLDNIIYGTNFKCTIGYTDEVIRWVENLLALLRGRNVNFLSGHTHENGKALSRVHIISWRSHLHLPGQ